MAGATVVEAKRRPMGRADSRRAFMVGRDGGEQKLQLRTTIDQFHNDNVGPGWNYGRKSECHGQVPYLQYCKWIFQTGSSFCSVIAFNMFEFALSGAHTSFFTVKSKVLVASCHVRRIRSSKFWIIVDTTLKPIVMILYRTI